MNGFERYTIEPAVLAIYVHLEGEDCVIFNEKSGTVDSAMSRLLIYLSISLDHTMLVLTSR